MNLVKKLSEMLLVLLFGFILVNPVFAVTIINKNFVCVSDYKGNCLKDIYLVFPKLAELIYSAEDIQLEEFKKRNELLDAGIANNSERLFNLWIGDRLTLEASYSNELEKLKKEDETSFTIIRRNDDNDFDSEIEIVYRLPFNFLTEHKKNKYLEELSRIDLFYQKNNSLNKIKILISDLYQDFELLKLAHDNCICSRSYETNCNSVFYKLKEKALEILFTSNFSSKDINSYVIVQNWINSQPKGCF